MEFVDRLAKDPNRVLITPESGTPFYAKLQRADNPIVEGTPLNALTFNEMISIIQTTAEEVYATMDMKANLNQGPENAGLTWMVAEDGSLTFGSSSTKMMNGPFVIEESQTIDFTQYGLRAGDQIYVICIGAGGGGGGACATTTAGKRAGAGGAGGYGAGGTGAHGGAWNGLNQSEFGSGGGGGGGSGYLAASLITLTDTTVDITVGIGGAGGTSTSSSSGAGNGAEGGSSSFGTYLVAEGGKGGKGAGNGGIGAATSGGSGGTGGHSGGAGGSGASASVAYGSYGGGGGGAGGGWVIESMTVQFGSAGEPGTAAKKDDSAGTNGADGTPGGYKSSGNGVVIFWY